MPKDIHKDICNKSLFSTLYQKHAQNLHDFLYYKYGAQNNPNDLMQEAFVKLWENCSKVVPSKAKSFLFTIANNLMLNALKHEKVVLKYQKIQPKEYTHESPEFLLEKEQYLQQYQQVLSSLTEDQRVAFTLSKIEGKKHKEIAELLGVTQKVIEYRIYSAFTILKKQLNHFNIK